MLYRLQVDFLTRSKDVIFRCPECKCLLTLIFRAGNGYNMVAHCGGELDSQMAQTPNPIIPMRSVDRIPYSVKTVQIVAPAHMRGAASAESYSSGMENRQLESQTVPSPNEPRSWSSGPYCLLCSQYWSQPRKSSVSHIVLQYPHGPELAPSSRSARLSRKDQNVLFRHRLHWVEGHVWCDQPRFSHLQSLERPQT